MTKNTKETIWNRLNNLFQPRKSQVDTTPKSPESRRLTTTFYILGPHPKKTLGVTDDLQGKLDIDRGDCPGGRVFITTIEQSNAVWEFMIGRRNSFTSKCPTCGQMVTVRNNKA